MPERQPFRFPAFSGDLYAGLHNECTLMLFAMYLVDKALSGRARQASTVLSYCSLLRTHLAVEFGIPLTASSPRWRKLAKALQRLHQGERRLCRALRAAHLTRAYVGGLAANDAWSVNRYACAAAGWQLLARPRELINLKRSDLVWSGDHWIVMLTPLKKRIKQHPVPIPIAPGDGSGCDAFLHLCRLVTLDPVPPGAASSTPLFRRNARALTLADVTTIVRDVVRTAGEGADARLFSGRSLRIGGATEIAAMDVSPLTVQLLGRWDSEVYRAYVRCSRGRALSLSAAMGRAGSRPHDPTLEALFRGYTQSA